MKLLIEIDDKYYEALNKVGNNVLEFNDNLEGRVYRAIANGTPVSTDGDSISRSDLKKAIEEVEGNYDGYEPNDLGRFMNKVDDLIDNAMTVEEPERLKGEWILNKDENPECPFCHHSFTYFGNFCSDCGADLR